MSALRTKLSRVIDCIFRPTRLAGMMKIGSRINATSVICHCSANMTMSVVVSTTMLETTVPRVPVTARWAPMTSLFIRLMSAPVWVRVKKAIGRRCTWSKSLTRRS